MTEPERIDVKDLIGEILARDKTYHYIAKLMRRQVIQIQRMHRSGRCQPHERDRLVMIRDDCLQNVSSPSTNGGG